MKTIPLRRAEPERDFTQLSNRFLMEYYEIRREIMIQQAAENEDGIYSMGVELRARPGSHPKGET